MGELYTGGRCVATRIARQAEQIQGNRCMRREGQVPPLSFVTSQEHPRQPQDAEECSRTIVARRG